MRKLTRTIILMLVLVLLAIWAPWLNWNINLDVFGITRQSTTASLQVTSLAGEIQVYIDDKQEPLGTVTPDNSPLLLPGIESGIHQVRLSRVSDVENAYWEYNELIDFVNGADVILAYELGPTAEFSEGHLIYTNTLDSKESNQTKLNITSDVEDVTIYMDGTKIGSDQVLQYQLDLSSQHKIALEAPGYERQEFVILPEAQEDRDKLKGLSIIVEADLFLQPIAVTNE